MLDTGPKVRYRSPFSGLFPAISIRHVNKGKIPCHIDICLFNFTATLCGSMLPATNYKYLRTWHGCKYHLY